MTRACRRSTRGQPRLKIEIRSQLPQKDAASRMKDIGGPSKSSWPRGAKGAEPPGAACLQVYESMASTRTAGRFASRKDTTTTAATANNTLDPPRIEQPHLKQPQVNRRSLVGHRAESKQSLAATTDRNPTPAWGAPHLGKGSLCWPGPSGAGCRSRSAARAQRALLLQLAPATTPGSSWLLR